MNREQMRADVIIPVYGPDEKFYKLIARLMQQTVLPRRIIVMNTDRALWESSGAPDQLRALGAALLCEVHHVTKAEFDHGGTRNLGVSFSKTPRFVMMTQDAVPADRLLLETLLAPLDRPRRLRRPWARSRPRAPAGRTCAAPRARRTRKGEERRRKADAKASWWFLRFVRMPYHYTPSDRLPQPRADPRRLRRVRP